MPSILDTYRYGIYLLNKYFWRLQEEEKLAQWQDMLMTASDGSLHNVPAALEYIEESRKSPESQSSSSRIVTNKKKRLRESDIIVPDFFGNKTELKTY